MSIIFYNDEDGKQYVHAAGYVTREPKVFDKVVLFGLCYAKGKYLDCKAWRNDATGRIAECLEKHDVIAIDGVKDKYTNRDGEEKEEVMVDAILSSAVPSAAVPQATAPESGKATFTPLDDDFDEDGLPF